MKYRVRRDTWRLGGQQLVIVDSHDCIVKTLADTTPIEEAYRVAQAMTDIDDLYGEGAALEGEAHKAVGAWPPTESEETA